MADHKLSVVGRRKLVQAEEAQVCEDLIKGRIITICVAKVPLKEYSCKDLLSQLKTNSVIETPIDNDITQNNSTYLEELLVPGAAVKDLFDEDLLVWIRELNKGKHRVSNCRHTVPQYLPMQ